MIRVVYLFTLIATVMGCGMQSQSDKPVVGQDGSIPEAQVEIIYNTMCALCHGKDGKLEYVGAADLSQSSLTVADRITVITHGKGTMTPFVDRLTKEEIEAVAIYLDKLKD